MIVLLMPVIGCERGIIIFCCALSVESVYSKKEPSKISPHSQNVKLTEGKLCKLLLSNIDISKSIWLIDIEFCNILYQYIEER